MQGCFENAFVNDTSLDPRPLPSLHMRTRYSALSSRHGHNLVPRGRDPFGQRRFFQRMTKGTPGDEVAMDRAE